MATENKASLYTNINHKGAINAAKWALVNNRDMNRQQIKFTVECLDFA